MHNERPAVDAGIAFKFKSVIIAPAPLRRCEKIEKSTNFHADFLGK